MTVSNKSQSGRSRLPRISSTVERVSRSRPSLPQIWTTPSSRAQPSNTELPSAQSSNTEAPSAQSSKAQSSTTRQPSWARPTKSSQLREQHTEWQKFIEHSSQPSQLFPSSQPSWSKAFSRLLSTKEKNKHSPSSPHDSQIIRHPKRPISAASSESFNVGPTITGREGFISREELIRNAVSNGRASRASIYSSLSQIVGTQDGVVRYDIADPDSQSTLSPLSETSPISTIEPLDYEMKDACLSSGPSVLSIPVLVRKIESGNPASSSIGKTLNRKPAIRQLSAQYQHVLPLAKAHAELVRSEIRCRFEEDPKEKAELARDTAEFASVKPGLKDSELQSLNSNHIDHGPDALLPNEDKEEEQQEREWSRTLERIHNRCREVSDMYKTLNKTIKIQGAVQDKNRRKMLELSELVSEPKPLSTMNFSKYETDPKTGLKGTSRSQSSLRNELIQEEAELYPRSVPYRDPSAPLPALALSSGLIESKLERISHTSSPPASELNTSNETGWPEDTIEAVDPKLERNSDVRPELSSKNASDPALETDSPDDTKIKGSPSPSLSPNSRLDFMLEKTRHVSFQFPLASEPAPCAGRYSPDNATIRASSPASVPSPSSSTIITPTHDSNGVPLISPYASDPRFNVDYDYGLGTDQHFVAFYPLTEYEVRMTTGFNRFAQSAPILTNLDLLEGDLVTVEEVVELEEDAGEVRIDENADAGDSEERSKL